ncbi:MAG: hypothetical protein A2X97_02735 [Bdellovibrionales bacterium GWA1_52_35]|nr:MAG: hypothetical protein A2X97_02735 [Bdellovibrionales bacterium GWA1_52_35]
MADVSGKFNSFINKLTGRSPALDRPASETREPTSPALSSQEQEAQFSSLNEADLKDAVSSLSERAVIRCLQTFTNQELKIRILQAVSDQATLKRVNRSAVDKKLKRIADKQLRKITGAGTINAEQELTAISERIQEFLVSPDWSSARDLLNEAFDAKIDDSQPSQTATHFVALRTRLKAKIDLYEKTCAEMEAISDQLDPARANSISRVVRENLQKRFKELEEKYAFPQDFVVLQKFARNLEAGDKSRKTDLKRPAELTTSQPDLNKADQLSIEKKEKQERAEKNREYQARELDQFLTRIREAGEQLRHPKIESELRFLKKALADLQRWRSNFPEKLSEAETLLKELFSKRAEVANEEKWSAWARTERAQRIQAELAELIAKIETAGDPETALVLASGLGQRLFDWSREMKELGSLERGKDHKIWEQFKTQTDQGWVLCDKMRDLALESLKAIVSEHLAKPIELTATVLSDPRTRLEFKSSAFDETVAAKVRELQTAWSQIGEKKSSKTQERNIVFGKLFETYFRFFNLQLGQVKRIEKNAIEKKQNILAEMRNVSEPEPSTISAPKGAIRPIVQTLVNRLRTALSIEERWKRDPLPEGARELQKQFDLYQTRLGAELMSELEKQVSLAQEIQPKLQAVLEQIQAKTGANLPRALQAVDQHENEIRTVERYLTQLREFSRKFDVQFSETTFRQVSDLIRQQVSQARQAVKDETTQRAEARNAVIREAESLALSADWDASRARFEELANTWKTTGSLGQPQDSLFNLVFENIRSFFLSRSECREKACSSDEKMKIQNRRKELLLSLEALARFSKAETFPLPFLEEERARASGKILELGFKYNQILSLDPKEGILKETKKIMTEWARQGMPEDRMPEYWAFYLKRVYALLGIRF